MLLCQGGCPIRCEDALSILLYGAFLVFDTGHKDYGNVIQVNNYVKNKIQKLFNIILPKYRNI